MEEIVIKTETVKIEELQGREKQIYDYAYQKGINEALDENLRHKHGVWACIAFALFLTVCLFGLYFKPF